MSAGVAALTLAACGGGTDAPGDTAGGKTGGSASDSNLDVTVHKGDFAEIQQFTTPGGASVWLVSEPSIPILSLQMAWKGGAAADPEGLEGLSNAVVYHMNEGAGDLDSLAFQTRMEELNMSFGCSAGSEWTSCSTSMLTENADDAMALVASAFEAPRMDEGPFERFRRENLVSIKQRETSAGFLGADAMESALYPDHVYAREMSEDSMNALTPTMAKEHMRKLMVKDRLLVTAVGAISPDELAPLIDAAMAPLPDSSDLAVTPPVAMNPPVADPIVVNLPQPQSSVSFVAPGPERDDEDFFAAYVLNYTVGGGGFESRLMKTLRVEKGLTYGVGTGLSTGEALNTWRGGGQTKNESAGEFIDGVKAELQAFVDTGMTQKELDDAKAYLIGSYALGFDSNAKIAGNMMSVRQDDLGVDYFDTRNAQVEAVTLEDVNRVADAYLSPENFTFVVVGEPGGL
jgi:zinc protease